MYLITAPACTDRTATATERIGDNPDKGYYGSYASFLEYFFNLKSRFTTGVGLKPPLSRRVFFDMLRDLLEEKKVASPQVS